MEKSSMESREEKESQRKILWKIFISTLYLSAFTFGGGYVIVTLMKKKFVDEYHWIGEDEILRGADAVWDAGRSGSGDRFRDV